MSAEAKTALTAILSTMTVVATAFAGILLVSWWTTPPGQLLLVQVSNVLVLTVITLLAFLTGLVPMAAGLWLIGRDIKRYCKSRKGTAA